MITGGQGGITVKDTNQHTRCTRVSVVDNEITDMTETDSPLGVLVQGLGFNGWVSS